MRIADLPNTDTTTTTRAALLQSCISGDGLSIVFQALASADRLAVIGVLCLAYTDSDHGDGTLSITEIAARTEQSRFRASRNLAILRRSGLVVAHRAGHQLRHHLAPSGFEPLEDWIYPLVDVLADTR